MKFTSSLFVVLYIIIQNLVNTLPHSIQDLIKIKTNAVEPTKYDVDYNTFSNYHQVESEKFELNWFLDLDKQLVKGNVTIHFKVTDKNLKEVHLDMWDQEIYKVTLKAPQVPYTNLPFTVKHFTEEEQGDQGQQLKINIENYVQDILEDEKQCFKLTIEYSFDNSANAVSFLTKEQTSTKKLPYLYSQCEPIYCRSMVPLQDTPIIKTTYVANVTANKELNVYMSANKTGTVENGPYTTHMFNCSIPIPSYLVTIIAGNVIQQQVGARTYVITEPDMMEKSADDLSDLEDYLIAVEGYTKIPYIWGVYKIVILPPSFPFGGMENPLLTFASPSIIVGDKSGTSVAIHEIAHSWTGNMVTCANWTSLWLNEGFTVFLERKAQVVIYGKDFMEMDSIVGNQTFIADINDFGLQSNFSSLFPLVANRNPDDSFSTVPYEKGYQFLTFIEKQIGVRKMQKLIESWISANTFQSRVVDDLYEFYQNFIEANFDEETVEYFNQIIDWNVWVKEPGLPPMDDLEEIHFSTSQDTEAVGLADEWMTAGGKKPKDWEALLDFNPNQIYVFLGHLYQNLDDLSVEMLSQMESCYKFNETPNLEIAWRWYQITIYVGYEDAKDDIFNFLGTIGRQKMILPQYKAYVATGQRDYAAEVFANYYDFYHPIARISIEQILA